MSSAALSPNLFVRRPRRAVRVLAILIAVTMSAWAHDFIAFVIAASGIVHRVAIPVPDFTSLRLDMIEPPKEAPIVYHVPSKVVVDPPAARALAKGGLRFKVQGKRAREEQEALSMGILAVLSSTDENQGAISSIFGELDDANGEEGGVVGGLIGAAPGDGENAVYGVGGLGLRGTGVSGSAGRMSGGGDLRGFGGLGVRGEGTGGGGTGETIGIGSLGTIGHGSGTGRGSGSGYGTGHGALRSHGSRGSALAGEARGDGSIVIGESSSADSDRAETDAWKARVAAAIAAHWAPPAASRGGDEMPSKIRVFLVIDAQGRVPVSRVLGGAGTSLDHAARAAIEAATPLPAPPASRLHGNGASAVIDIYVNEPLPAHERGG